MGKKGHAIDGKLDVPASGMAWKDAKSFCKTVGMSLPASDEMEHIQHFRFSEMDDFILPLPTAGSITAPRLQPYPLGLENTGEAEWTSEQKSEWHGGCYDAPAQPVTIGKGGTVLGGPAHKVCHGKSTTTVRAFNYGWVSPDHEDEKIRFRCVGDLPAAR
jgi:hypothetical protein